MLSLAAFALSSMVVACGGGGGNDTPTSPSPTPSPGGSGSSGGTTITIQSGGSVSPSVLTIAQGTRVTFVNSDSRNHDVQDDPHPTHGDCPDIQQVGFLMPGQQRQTGNLNVIRTCGWHDHDNPTIRGSIVVQQAQQSQ